MIYRKTRVHPASSAGQAFSGSYAGTRADVAELDTLLGGADLDNALDEDAGRMDVVGIELAGGNEMLDLGDGDFRGGGHHRIEVPRRLAVDQIAGGVALPGMNDREVGEQAALHQIFLAVELAHFLAFGNQRADAGLGEEGGNAGPSRTDALGERALRIELEFQFARQELLGEQLVLADIGGDHLPDLPCLEQPRETDAVDAGIVRHHREALHAGVADRIRQGLGDATEAETTGHDHHAVLEEAVEGGFGVGINLVHEIRPRGRKRPDAARIGRIIRRNLRNASMTGVIRVLALWDEPVAPPMALKASRKPFKLLML